MDDGLLALVEGRDVTGTSLNSGVGRPIGRVWRPWPRRLKPIAARREIFITGCARCSSSRPSTATFCLPTIRVETTSSIPYEGHRLALARRFEEAVALYRAHQARTGTSDALSSALAAAYHGLAFKTLAQQVQKTVRSVRGRYWMPHRASP